MLRTLLDPRERLILAIALLTVLTAYAVVALLDDMEMVHAGLDRLTILARESRPLASAPRGAKEGE